MEIVCPSYFSIRRVITLLPSKEDIEIGSICGVNCEEKESETTKLKTRRKKKKKLLRLFNLQSQH
jgi:hypothetical protein